MKKDQLSIVVLGEPSHVFMTCNHLASELENANVKFVPIIISPTPDDSIGHAFTPFSPVFSPVLSSPDTSKNGFEAITITTYQNQDTLSFNFADYGEPSAAVNFHQAYETSKKNSRQTPSMSAFMTRNKKTFGICYRRNEIVEIFKRQCFKKNIYAVVTNEVSVSIQNGAISQLVTQEGQRITGDLYIDCSQAQILMGQLQDRTRISTKTIPHYQVNSTQISINEKAHSKLTSQANAITCNIQTNGLREERRYAFAQSNCKNQASYYIQPWISNCVAMGHGYCEIPELLICKDRILETQLNILALFLPITSDFTSAQNHFAMHSQRILDDAVDSANLLISSACSYAELSPTNAIRKELFESSGASHQRELALINNSCWGALLRQVGVEPISTNALAEARPPADITRKLMQLVTGA